MILRRIVFVLVLMVFGLAAIPTLILKGDEGIDWLADRLNVVGDWAGMA